MLIRKHENRRTEFVFDVEDWFSEDELDKKRIEFALWIDLIVIASPFLPLRFAVNKINFYPTPFLIGKMLVSRIGFPTNHADC